MLLTSTTDKLSLTTAHAGDIDVVVTYMDRTTSSGVMGSAASQRTTITLATTTDILAAPSADTQRLVLAINIRNVHATLANDVTINYNANGTLYEMQAARLYGTSSNNFVGDQLQWNEEDGWELIKIRQRIYKLVVADDLTRSSAAITGSTINITTVPGTMTEIPTAFVDSKSVVVRHFVALMRNLVIAAATTTGTAFGFLMPSAPFVTARNVAIVSVTASVTGATHATQAVVGGNQVGACGTSTTAGWLLSMVSGCVILSDDRARSPFIAYEGMQSEVAASLASSEAGAHFEFMESTED